jgi:glycosyltransferase involved in cell wall biosynthesis
MSLIYEYLERQYGYDFLVVHSKSEDYHSDSLETASVPPSAWKPTVPHTPVFLRRYTYRKHLDPLVASADAVLTVDPTIFYQGALVISRADIHNTPVLYDASKTIAEPGPHWYAIRPVVRRAVERTAGIVATVPKVMERYRDLGLFGQDIARKFEVMGHPVDTERFVPATDDTDERGTSGPVTVLAVSRLVPEKGVYYLLEAMTPLLEDNIATLRLLGEGPMEPLLRHEVDERGVGSSVEFVGTVPHDRVPEVLRTADVFVNHAVGISSWEEYFGVANLEAMSCALPTVVTDCGGISYVIRDNDVAEVVSQRDVDELRRTIERLIDDPQRRHQLGKAGRAYVENHYSVTAVGERYHAMLKRLL